MGGGARAGCHLHRLHRHRHSAVQEVGRGRDGLIRSNNERRSEEIKKRKIITINRGYFHGIKRFSFAVLLVLGALNVFSSPESQAAVLTLPLTKQSEEKQRPRLLCNTQTGSLMFQSVISLCAGSVPVCVPRVPACWMTLVLKEHMIYFHQSPY